MNARGETHHAFLLDVVVRGAEVAAWFVTDDDRRLRVIDTFAPEILFTGAEKKVLACARGIERAGDGESAGWKTRRDLWTDAPVRAFAVRLANAATWTRRLTFHARRHPEVTWHQADLLPEQRWCAERDVFPTARCAVTEENGRLLALTLEDDRWATEWEVPPLRRAELRGEGRLLGPSPHLEALTLECEGTTLTWDEPEGMLEGFQRAIDDLDPDVILTEDGDAFLMPLLFTLAARLRFPLRLDREPDAPGREVATEGRSFFSYGRVLYHAPDCVLRGRWHLDRKGWLLGEEAHTGYHGLLEVARLSRLPVQRVARRSIGTGLTAMQIDMAHREGFLIPWRKAQPEAWKTARQLMFTDRGGLVYAPITGFHERVVELDFVSMFPSIMAWFNVSPETVNCACCDNARVPEIGYTICERRWGLVSRCLAPIVEKRKVFKRLREEALARGDEAAWERFQGCVAALKWILVCSFGYLGYRNARFGRIEAHEAVNAFSRELLQRAKEVCEDRGWRMLHANVDSVWIVKPGFGHGEIAPLCEAIDRATGLTIALEGIHKWITFLPSRQDANRPVPTRFFGAFEDGSLKVRGIEVRRRDLPPLIREEQARLLRVMAEVDGGEGLRALAPRMLEEIDALESRLRRHEVPLEQLIIRQSLSKEPEEYRGNGLQALAARQSIRARLRLHAGQSLHFLITDQCNADPDARVRLALLIDHATTADPVAYIRLLRRAMNTLLWPVGIRLDEEMKETRPQGPRRSRSRDQSEQLQMGLG